MTAERGWEILDRITNRLDYRRLGFENKHKVVKWSRRIKDERVWWSQQRGGNRSIGVKLVCNTSTQALQTQTSWESRLEGMILKKSLFVKLVCSHCTSFYLIGYYLVAHHNVKSEQSYLSIDWHCGRKRLATYSCTFTNLSWAQFHKKVDFQFWQTSATTATTNHVEQLIALLWFTFVVWYQSTCVSYYKDSSQSPVSYQHKI